MITYQPTKPTPTPAACIETDPVRLIASAMRELAFNGRTVDREPLMQRLHPRLDRNPLGSRLRTRQ